MSTFAYFNCSKWISICYFHCRLGAVKHMPIGTRQVIYMKKGGKISGNDSGGITANMRS